MSPAPDSRAPCLIGVGRRTWHPADVDGAGAPEPLAMWEEVARMAASDAGTASGTKVLTSIESLQLIYCQSWEYDDPAERLAVRLGASPARRHYSGIGGSVPQTLLSEAASQIMAGNLDLALVVGGEALATTRRLKKAGSRPQWSFGATERRPFPFDIPFHPAEVAHSIFEAYVTFAMFDSAHRAHLRRDLDDHRRRLGHLMAPLTSVAQADPANAWFPIRRDAVELSTATGDNRMVAFPYTKLMMAIMDVDMAAAVLIASHAEADALGVPSDRRVYLRGWGYARDPDYVAERRDLWRSPAMAVAGRAALAGAGIGIDDVAHLDLYSCFPSSVLFAAGALGLDPDVDESGARPLTVTGGLPYHGGPGSDYMTHSIAAMATRLRADPGSFGLTSGVGMHMTKHAFGLWSAEPGPIAPPDESALARDLAREVESVVDDGAVGSSTGGPAAGPGGKIPITAAADGAAIVAAYTVIHDRAGAPSWGPAVCNLPDGSRCYARLEDQGTLAFAEDEELIGRTVHLASASDGVNRAQV
ncbi:MAG: acetyl-CoA synthetase [Acidimicrobiales bacterium]